MSKYNLINKSSTLLLVLATIFTVGQYQSLQAQETDSNVTIEDIAEENNVALGEEVTVRGEVTEVEPGMSFVLQEEGLFEGDEVLVINVSQQMLPEQQDNLELQVTGEKGMLVVADVEQEYGLDLNPEFYVDYENKPVIFASSMVLSPEIEDVAENPDRYYTQEIAVKGEVKNINSDYAFILREDKLFSDDNLLIVNTTGEPIPNQDEKVVVTGTVRPYVKAEFEKEYNLTWDLDIQEEIEAEYTNNPVLIVDSIYPSAQDQGLLE